ncbi:MAG: hypothetical protein WD749_09630 [Phycisphaerales bacterium]
MRHATTALLAAIIAAPAALAQPLAPTPPPQPPAPAPRQPEMTPTQRMATLPGGRNVIFETMAVTGPDGKVIRIDAALDLAALQRNPLITAEAREGLRPAIREWMGEVERIAIDNLDFLEDLEPPAGGPTLLDKLDSTNTNSMQRVNQVMLQLSAAGNLAAVLRGKNLIDQPQHTINQYITSDYLRQCLQEVAPSNEVIRDVQQSQDRTNRYNRFLYSVSASDAMSAYHRLLIQAAPVMDRAVAAAQLPPEALAKARDKAAGAMRAQGDAARRAASRALLNELTFPQRQAVLRAARDLAPPFDPFPGAPSAHLPSPRSGG